VGRHAPAVVQRGLGVRHQRTLLVRVRCDFTAGTSTDGMGQVIITRCRRAVPGRPLSKALHPTAEPTCKARWLPERLHIWRRPGATVQILLFGILAIEVKRKAPTAHTILEIVRARWGTAAHLTFLFFCLLTNCIVRLCSISLVADTTSLHSTCVLPFWHMCACDTRHRQDP